MEWNNDEYNEIFGTYQDEPLAKENNTNYFELGCNLMNGIGNDKNPALSVETFKKGAEEGNPACMTALADCYINGIYIEQNIFKAVSLYEDAAAKDYANAIYKLGELHLEGSGVTKDINEAYRCFEKAASLGSTEAMTRLALWYCDGVILDTDYDKALCLLEKAAEDDPRAEYYLSEFKKRGIGGYKAENTVSQTTDNSRDNNITFADEINNIY